MSQKKEKNIWSDADEAKLFKLLSEDNSLDKITKKIKKNEKEIRYKLKKIALKMCGEKKTKDEISKALKFLSDDQINKIINHVTKKNLNNANGKTANGKNSNDFSEFGIVKTKSKIIKNVSSNNSNEIILMLTKINEKLDFIIDTSNKNISPTTKKNLKSQSNNVSSSNNDSSVQNNKLTNNQTANDKKKSEESDLSSSGEDTDDIINMINKNRGGGR